MEGELQILRDLFGLQKAQILVQKETTTTTTKHSTLKMSPL